ncbi:MAG: NAD(P)/FAD-dependent oxidoreductase [Turneriella sp.]|nr:NAD(P)/FAD-dependent oxidoreductase [Turneriella sp.]
MAARPVLAQAAGARLPEIAIVGNGIAGISAALRLRELLPQAKIQVFSDETELFYARTALMYVYMRHIQFKDTIVYPRAFYRKKNITLVKDTITALDPESRILEGCDGKYYYDFLILAPGSRPRRAGVPGEDLDGVLGLYSKNDLDRLEAITRRYISQAVVVGGGLIGVELAEMLSSRKIPVLFLVREPFYYSHVLPLEEAMLVPREVGEHVALRCGTLLEAIEGKKAVQAVLTHAGEKIPCDLVGVTIGVEPRTELARAAGLATATGILTDEYLATSHERIYAAGDAAEVPLPDGTRRVQQIWYTGRMQGALAGENIAAAITGKKQQRYEPGVFFNSARFFRLDYQTYGQVSCHCDSKNSILWQDIKTQRLVRIAFEPAKPSHPVIGFNALGVRLNHRVCEEWIQNQVPLERVVADFGRAVFDPEFSQPYAAELRKLL